VIRIFSYIGAAVPPFVVAIIGIFIFAFNTNLLPVLGRISPGVPRPPTITGMITIDALITGNFAALIDSLWHIILPSLSMIFLPTALEARITRSSVVENLNKDYIQSAISHGLPERTIMLKYLLKPSIIPTVSDMALQIASMLSTLFVVETIFSWHGFAWYGMNAMLTKDLNAIIGVIMVTGVIYAVANIIVDIIVEWIDPRIRQTE
jgi:peptide/nickel transport system permease protein